MRITATIATLTAVGLAGGCPSAGIGPEVRADITARMTSVQPQLSACYAAALAARRREQGTMWLSFTAQPDSGQFVGVVIGRDELNDPALRRCVGEEVSKLRLAAPQSTGVSITYPVHFAPTN